MLESTAAQTGTFTVFEQTYEREEGKPRQFKDWFTVLNPDTSYFVKVDNGAGGRLALVSSGTIYVNQMQVVGPENLKRADSGPAAISFMLTE